MQDKQTNSSRKRKRKEETKSKSINLQQIPVYDSSSSCSLSEQYKKCWALLIPKSSILVDQGKDGQKKSLEQEQQQQKETTCFSWKNIYKLFSSCKEDESSWCIENKRDSAAKPPLEFLKPEIIMDCAAYSSFLLQKDQILYQSTLEKLPVQDISLHFDETTTPEENDDGKVNNSSKAAKWTYEPCIWFFFGRNHSSQNDGKCLDGRAEHTDSVSHDGTWHYQLSGTKRWFLRPTEQLAKYYMQQQQQRDTTPDTIQEFTSIPLVVDCRQGDVLILNTRLWWHKTVIPPQPLPSVSYARDFYMQQQQQQQDNQSSKTTTTLSKSSMLNVDGMYATRNIDADTILFTEKDMPDGELHRSSTDPNCILVELEDGIQAVVSCRPIGMGEFFCLAESSDEEEEEEADGDDEDNDEESD